MNYKEKYILYKKKYLELKGGQLCLMKNGKTMIYYIDNNYKGVQNRSDTTYDFMSFNFDSILELTI